jgi:hypothetical protein
VLKIQAFSSVRALRLVKGSRCFDGLYCCWQLFTSDTALHLRRLESSVNNRLKFYRRVYLSQRLSTISVVQSVTTISEHPVDSVVYYVTSNTLVRTWRLRRRSVASRLLGFRVRMSPMSWTSVSCECCVLSGRGLCVRLIPSPEESYRLWCAWVWSWSIENEVAPAH